MAVFGIMANLTKDIDLKLTSSIINWFEERNIKVLISDIAASKINRTDIGYSQDYIYNNIDILIVLGGDGTLLGAARNAALKGIPVFGINMGHLGFITEIEKEDTFSALESIINNEYIVQERILLESKIIKKDKVGESIYALNEAKLSRGTLSKMIKFNTYVDETLLETYFADGILISTPTGSTAYSLSAGGPIISPELNVMLMTPICAHTLYSRPIVLSDSKLITVEISDTQDEAFLICDGQQSKKLSNKDKVVISKAPFNVKFIKLLDRSFFDVLKNKLK